MDVQKLLYRWVFLICLKDLHIQVFEHLWIQKEDFPVQLVELHQWRASGLEI